MAFLPIAGSEKWYKTGWGITLLGLGGLIGALVLLFVGYVGYYWWQLKNGIGAAPIPAQQQFSSLKNPAASVAAHVDPGQVYSPIAFHLGNPNAPVTIVEFLDFKCPYCRSAVATMRQVVQKYPNKVQLVVRHFPLELVDATLHPGSIRLAQVAYCANQQQKFLPVHDWLYKNQTTISAGVTTDEINALAEATGANGSVLLSCMSEERTQKQIETDVFDGLRAGVHGTPTFFINGARVEGPQSLEWWVQTIDSLQ